MRGGTYKGKFRSLLSGGGVVRSAPGEWAVIDGYWTTTLTNSIDNGSTVYFDVGSTSQLVEAGEILIDTERMQVADIVNSTRVGVVRPWGGTSASAHAANSTVYLFGNQFTVTGNDTTYRDFEIMNSAPGRDIANLPIMTNQTGVFITGSGNRFINLSVHDNGGNGFFTSSSSSNTLIYGCISYNNGSFSSANGRKYGHGFYLLNALGYSKVQESFSLNSFSLGMQLYGVTGPFVGGELEGVVVAGSGAPVGESHYNLLWGPNSQASPTAKLTESVFYNAAPSNGTSVIMGYGAGVQVATVKDNYFLGEPGSGALFTVGNIGTSLTMTGNKFDRVSGNGYHVISDPGNYNLNNNSYYSTTESTTTKLGIPGVGGHTFSNWQSTTGFDTASVRNDNPMPDTVILRPNAHQPGRANVVVYAPSLPASVQLDLTSAGLNHGQSYSIKNAFNINGAAVTSGTFNASNPTITLPLNAAAKSVASPNGMATTPPTTCPRFCVFIVTPVGQ
ncbi:MAG: hypothetical protein DWQ47_03520 [Acidobacteria bacterium]|nr:MAG: hypothetical protein DWQ32_07070 [Acidobacteriota bacterium]REK01470.1 MAG: hypothetical protein DWQ38_03505 [Acidobacteriota bacterium]REK14426.1 MAG: hypothetical protein DWQ43_12760 [Acidobacteriota bacterium]REK45141.1 MAG: hypothetical protein DWQ47_03520 [Acidobacteriota bacterium]